MNPQTIRLSCGHPIDVNIPSDAPEDIIDEMVRLIETLKCAQCQPVLGREAVIR